MYLNDLHGAPVQGCVALLGRGAGRAGETAGTGWLGGASGTAWASWDERNCS